MKSVSISGSLRENVGKRDAKLQRNNGIIPCVIYGGKEEIRFLVTEGQFKNLLYTPEVLYADLDIDGKKFKAIVQETQFHPITDKLLHVDFLEIVDNKPITIDIPVKVTGVSVGVLRGGKLSKKARKLKVKGLLENIPEYISIDITPLEIDDSIKIADIKIDNVTVVEAPGKVVASVLSTRNVEAAPTEEA